jgi:hypothetical protein
MIKTKIIHLKEPITNLRTESIRINRDEPQKRIAPKQQIETKNEAIQQERMRGGGESEEEDLYFEGSEEEEDMPNNGNEEGSIEGKEPLATEVEGDEEERTKAIKKKMPVTTENIPFGHICDNIAVDNDTPYIRLYCQNVCGIFDREGIGMDSAFKEIKQAGADIFTFNETHGDESNATARRALRLSKQRMWRDNNEDCKIIHSSLVAPILNFTKPGGNMVGITGSLVEE